MMNCPRCEIEIDEHEANGCLDAWVAEAVMGLEKRVFEGQNSKSLWDDEFIFNEMESTGLTHSSPEGELVSLKDYSTSIAAAWGVVGRWNDGDEKHSNIAWNIVRPGLDDYWSCAFWGDLDHYKRYIGQGDSAPLAICRAALKAIYVGEDGK